MGGCLLNDLADRFGTPLYVLDEETVVGACLTFLEELRLHYPGPSTVLYASKALCNLAVNRLIHNQGLSTEVVSGGELATALRAGISGDRIYFQGNAKSANEIAAGLEARVCRFLVDNCEEMGSLADQATSSPQPVDVILRINPGVAVDTHEFVQTGHVKSKFGIQPGRDLESILEQLKQCSHIRFRGIQLHIGSQIFDCAAYERAARRAVELLAWLKDRGLSCEELDLGGGFGIAYREDDAPPGIGAFVRTICQTVVAELERRGLPLPRLMLEPGRAIVGTAGCTVYQIAATKTAPERRYVLLDGGMADNPRPVTYGASYSCDLVSGTGGAISEGIGTISVPVATWTVAGKACEEGDIVIKDAPLAVAPGDRRRLVVWTTGAYAFSMASNYNRLPRPAMVLVSGGRAELIRQRESYEELLALDRLPGRLA